MLCDGEGECRTAALSEADFQPILQTQFTREYEYIGKNENSVLGDGLPCLQIAFLSGSSVAVNAGNVGTYDRNGLLLSDIERRLARNIVEVG